MNGLPSSIYSTTNTSLTPLATSPLSRLPAVLRDDREHSSISPGLANASTPNLIANFPNGYFDQTSSMLKTPKSPTSPLVNPFASPVTEAQSTVPGLPSPPSRRSIVESPARTKPLVVKKKSVPPVNLNPEELAKINQEIAQVAKILETAPSLDVKATLPHKASSSSSSTRPTAQAIFASSPKKVVPVSSVSTTTVAVPNNSGLPALPFRVVKPSLETLEKAMSIALFFEQYYHALLKPAARVRTSKPAAAPIHPGNYVLNRARRLAQLEQSFLLPENRFMSEGEKESQREELIRDENVMLRERRRKVDVKGFEMGRVIGHGAFGVVRIAREYQSGRLVAIKQLRKAE